jgi:hypothetical protein
MLKTFSIYFKNIILNIKMLHNQCLVKKNVNGWLANAKGGKLGCQNREIET